MKKSTGKHLKRLAAMALAAGMMTGTAVTSWASSSGMATPSFTGETKSVDSVDQTMDQEAVVWASVTDAPLKQLKVVLPIRLDFVVYKELVGQPQFLCGDYEIRVDGNSEIGVKLDKIKVVKPTGSGWTLKEPNALSSSDGDHAVAIKLAGTDLTLGDNAPESAFTVGIGDYKSLGMSGTTKATTVSKTAAAERAFQVTYTISQWDENTAPGA